MAGQRQNGWPRRQVRKQCSRGAADGQPGAAGHRDGRQAGRQEAERASQLAPAPRNSGCLLPHHDQPRPPHRPPHLMGSCSVAPQACSDPRSTLARTRCGQHPFLPAHEGGRGRGGLPPDEWPCSLWAGGVMDWAPRCSECCAAWRRVHVYRRRRNVMLPCPCFMLSAAKSSLDSWQQCAAQTCGAPVAPSTGS